MERLCRLANVMLSGAGPQFSLAQFADQLVEIFEAAGVARNLCLRLNATGI
jgi:hypothetical protein